MRSSNAAYIKQRAHYKSDDTDDLMEGLFTNKRATEKVKEKPKTEVDNIV